MEGSLFLLKRRSAPRFQIVVMNKLATGAWAPSVWLSSISRAFWGIWVGAASGSGPRLDTWPQG